MRKRLETPHAQILNWVASIIGGIFVVSCIAWGMSWLVATQTFELSENVTSQEYGEQRESEAQANALTAMCETLKADFNNLISEMERCDEDNDCMIIENRQGLMDLGGRRHYGCIVSTHKSSYKLVQFAVKDWAQCSRTYSACTFVPNGRHGTGGIARCKKGICGYESIPRISLEELQEQTKAGISEL